MESTGESAIDLDRIWYSLQLLLEVKTFKTASLMKLKLFSKSFEEAWVYERSYDFYLLLSKYKMEIASRDTTFMKLLKIPTPLA
jgi:hypothetical protein